MGITITGSTSAHDQTMMPASGGRLPDQPVDSAAGRSS